MMNMLKATVACIALAACVPPPGYGVPPQHPPMDRGRALQLEAERDFHADQKYRKEIYERRAYRPEVYANGEFFEDCEYYKMPECFR